MDLPQRVIILHALVKTQSYAADVDTTDLDLTQQQHVTAITVSAMSAPAIDIAIMIIVVVLLSSVNYSINQSIN